MAIASTVPRGDVTATLHFFQPPANGAKPFNFVDTPPKGQPQRNFGDNTHDTVIHDIRGREADFTLENDAFQVVQDVPPSKEAEFLEDKSVKEKYYPEVEQLLLDSIPGTNRIFIFDHTIRRPDSNRTPVTRVHIDQTAAAAAQRVRRYFPDEADKLLQGRYRIVNVWRPLNQTPIEASPLAVASSASVEDDDIIPVEHRYPDGYLGYTAAIRQNADQKWYYLSGMTGSERLLLECFDSEALKPGSKIKGRVPHTAFNDPRTRVDAEGRQSIEVRALVFGP